MPVKVDKASCVALVKQTPGQMTDDNSAAAAEWVNALRNCLLPGSCLRNNHALPQQGRSGVKW